MAHLDEPSAWKSIQTRLAMVSELAAWLVLMLLPCLLRAQLHAQATTVVSSPCEAALVKPTSDPVAYRLRGERCEGVYVREVAGTGGFSVVAFVVGGNPSVIDAGKPLAIEWPPGLDAPILLRAVSLRRNLYYRMDTRRPAASTRFDWPSDVLRDLELKMDEVGVVAWTESRMGESYQDVYVPIRVGSAGASPGESSYLLNVISGNELKEIYVRLATADVSGREQRVIIRDEPLKRGFYPAERAIPIRIAVATLKERGLYRLQLNAVLSNGLPASRILYFLHAGR
jgi:hypothetical protein